MNVERERADFEHWEQMRFDDFAEARPDGTYFDSHKQHRWEAWLARAKLDRGDMPPMMELPEGETP